MRGTDRGATGSTAAAAADGGAGGAGGASAATAGGGGLLAEVAALVGSWREACWILQDAGGDEELALRLAARRAAGEPLQHVLGHWSFRLLDVRTDGRALVPRPETEMVVEVALQVLEELAASVSPESVSPESVSPESPGQLPAKEAPVAGGGAGDVWLVADLGTGSGAIACAIALEAPVPVRLVATDWDEDALSLARENVEWALPPEVASRIELRWGSWFEALDARTEGSYAVIVSNPPYLAACELESLDPVVRDFDPEGALVAGPTGLEAIDHLLAGAHRWLAPAPAGVLVVELAPHQAAAAMELANSLGYSSAAIRKDLAGRDRVLVARR